VKQRAMRKGVISALGLTILNNILAELEKAEARKRKRERVRDGKDWPQIELSLRYMYGASSDK
jgi:hypothetical protein